MEIKIVLPAVCLPAFGIRVKQFIDENERRKEVCRSSIFAVIAAHRR